MAPTIRHDLAVEETTERTAKQTSWTIDGATERVPVSEGVPPSVPKPTTNRESESVAKEASATADEFIRARFRTRIIDWFLVAHKIDSRRELFQFVRGLSAGEDAGGNSNHEQQQSEDGTLDHLRCRLKKIVL